MGVAGCGKTTVGERLAAALGWPFAEGDRFHPQANVAKMAAGIPLEDADRWPWLRALADRIARAGARGARSVLACSALKRSYRDVLRTGGERVRFVHLHGDRAVLAARLAARTGHFFPAGLLDSQLGDAGAVRARRGRRGRRRGARSRDAGRRGTARASGLP